MSLAVLAGGGMEDLAGSSIVLVLELVLLLALDALFVAVPILVARRRAVAGAESIAAFAILWGILAAGFAGSAVVAEFRWAKERLTLLLRGYDVPATDGGGPKHPWTWWLALAGFYAALALLALLSKPRDAQDPRERPKGP